MPRRERLLGVPDEIEHDLLKLERIGPDRGQRRIEACIELHAVNGERITTHLEHARDDLVHPRGRPLRRVLARERQEVGDDLRGALGLGVDRAK